MLEKLIFLYHDTVGGTGSQTQETAYDIGMTAGQQTLLILGIIALIVFVVYWFLKKK